MIDTQKAIEALDQSKDAILRTADLVTESFVVGERILAMRSPQKRKALGQFLTPPTIARYLARQLPPMRDGDHVLEPAIGSGVLACAVIERVMQNRGEDAPPMTLWVDGYEVDPGLAQVARANLEQARELAASCGITLHTTVHERDFLSSHASPGPLFPLADAQHYDHVIANPPYFKLNKQDPRVKALLVQANGYTNIYTLFIALALKLLAPGAQASFIVPRSFCSGAYFSSFRKYFIQQALPVAVHLFEARDVVFEHSDVLQENIILTFQRRLHPGAPPPFQVAISTSPSAADLEKEIPGQMIDAPLFLGRLNGSLFFRLPVGALDKDLLQVVDLWKGSLHQYGLEVSTGPVVAFRAREYLVDKAPVDSQQAAPLLWMQNVQAQTVEWPVRKRNKPQGILLDAGEKLLVPLNNYVLLRRFSAKEERRRLIAAPFLAAHFAQHGTQLGLENHLNYIYRQDGVLTDEEAIGFSALLNSALIDRYFRILNGNTQVNATELRALPLPPLAVIRQLGQAIMQAGAAADLDAFTFDMLRGTGYLPPDFPTIRETRITMGKIQEAQKVLEDLGLPPAQQNEISALTLLTLAQLFEATPWGQAQRCSLRIHDMLAEMKAHYDRDYAENTRETVRRQVIHQFQQAGLVLRNPDEPGLPTNSPRTHYALSDLAIQTLQAYGSPRWESAVQEFNRRKGALLEVYQKVRDQHKVPLRLADGRTFYLSPGEHNELQALVIQEFGPRFAPAATVLYLGDTANKKLILEEDLFMSLGVPAPDHDKLPDVILFDAERNWLFLIEAVTSHGPLSPKRHVELSEMFESCSADLVYVTAFLDFATFKGFLSEIAWETEVWVAEIVDHLIHFNGDRFLGPRE
ncbi:MAG: BsuBI/PstI family type II restriction endonuclease [Anaerolineae bacterium]